MKLLGIFRMSYHGVVYIELEEKFFKVEMQKEALDVKDLKISMRRRVCEDNFIKLMRKMRAQFSSKKHLREIVSMLKLLHSL